METLVNVGQEITLHAQLSDGDLSLPRKVKAILRDPNATVIDTIELNHMGQGLFVNSSIQMPELPFITAQYFVYQPDGESIDYSYTAGMNLFRNSKLINAGGGGSASSMSTEITAEVEIYQQELTVEVENYVGD